MTIWRLVVPKFVDIGPELLVLFENVDLSWVWIILKCSVPIGYSDFKAESR